MNDERPVGRTDRWADELLDDLLPEELDWRRLTRTYPTTSLAIAAAGGFLVAWSRGPALVGGISALVSRAVARNVESVLSGVVDG